MAKKGKRNSVKFKWTKELIFLIVALVAIITTTVILAIPSEASKRTAEYNNAISAYNTTNSTQYGLLSEDNVYSEVDYEGAKNVIDDSGYTYILYGSLNNPTVLEYLSIIQTAAKDNKISTVYFYSSSWVENQEDLNGEEFVVEYKAREKVFNANKDVNEKDFTLLTYPTILVYKDGTMIFNSQTSDDSTDFSWKGYVQRAFYTFNAEADK